MVEPKYKRILIKLSGEALAGERGVGIDIKTVQNMAQEIKEVHELGIEIALVIGGGNLWRGEPAAEAGMDRVQADYTGMLGTVKQRLPCNKSQNLIFVVVPFVTLKKIES